MPVIAGKNMAVSAGGTTESTVRGFRLETTAEIAAYVASKPSGAEGQVPGHTDWRGMYWGYGHTPNVFPGDDFAFVGSLDGTAGIAGTALCERLRIRVPVEEGKRIQYEVTLGANSSLSLTAAASDTTAVKTISPKSRDVAFDGVVETLVRYWELDWYLNRPRPYRSSATDGETRRKKGAIAGRWMFGVYTSDVAALVARENTFSVMKFNVTAAKYWQMTYGHLKRVKDLTANYGNDEWVNAEVVGVFSGVSGAVLGSIIDPEGATRWP